MFSFSNPRSIIHFWFLARWILFSQFIDWFIFRENDSDSSTNITGFALLYKKGKKTLNSKGIKVFAVENILRPALYKDSSRDSGVALVSWKGNMNVEYSTRKLAQNLTYIKLVILKRCKEMEKATKTLTDLKAQIKQ